MTVQGVVSVTVLDATQELDRELADRDVMLWLAALPPRAVEVARRTHWWPEWEGAGRVHPTVDAAVGRFRADAPAPAPGSGEGPDQL